MRTRTGPLALAALAVCACISRAQPTTAPTTNPSNVDLPSVPSPPAMVTPVTAPVSKPVAATQPRFATTQAIQAVPLEVANPSPNLPLEKSRDLGKVVVSSDLDLARDQIAPSLGAVTHTLGPEAIEQTPGGENAPFQQVLLRAPGVVQDSFGQEHVRGEHANLTYRVNGVLLPEPLNGFGQELDTRLIRSTTLITGSLPAQFGFHTAGIVDVTTKSGDTLDSNEISFYGGSYDTAQPAIQFGGSEGKLDYFFTASSLHSDIGIENPTGSHHPLHDYTDQQRFFGYLNYRVDDTSRLSLLANASNSDFQIPNTPNVAPSFDLANHPKAFSQNVNENQNEQLYYLVGSYQKTIGEAAFQLSGFSRYGQIRFTPDPVNDLIFQGVSGRVVNSFVTNGVQLDGSYILNDQHTLRGGFIADYTQERLTTDTSVFPASASGAQTSDTAFSLSDESSNHAWEAGVYVQDEFRVNPKLTLNYGLRFDRFDSNFDSEDQLSPRVNAVFKVDERTTLHAGYSRYFVTPPVQYVSEAQIREFTGTTNAPANFGADAPKVERSNYYDLGVEHQITKPWGVNLDGYYKQAKNLIDLGQFGAPVILAPFNYRKAEVFGAELSTTYKFGGFSTYGNFSWVKTLAHDIDSQEFLIDSDELAYIRNHNIHLDHDNEFAISAGASYAWKNDAIHADILYGSGLRAGFANTHQLQQHYPVNVGYEHVFRAGGKSGKGDVKFRFDVVNVFDEKYQLRDGSGIGVGQPQFGERRAFFAGVSYAF